MSQTNRDSVTVTDRQTAGNVADGSTGQTNPGGGSVGTITSFSAGGFSPLFTTTVATASTTPGLSFAAVAQNPNLVYAGPATTPAAAPTFRSLVTADFGTALTPQFARLGLGQAAFASSSLGATLGATNAAYSAFLNGNLTITYSVDGAYNHYGLDSGNYISVASGITNSSSVYGLHVNVLRNYTAVSAGGDSGTLVGLNGGNITYGHNGTNAGETPLTTTIYGLKLKPFAKTGTIGTLYDLFIATPVSGGTVSTHWGIYQEDPTAVNFFAGTVQALRMGIGIAPNATRLLTVAGNIFAGDQAVQVPITTATGAASVARVGFHFENPTAFTPSASGDAALYGFYSTPRLAPTATTYSNQAFGFYATPQVISSDAGTRLSLAGGGFYVFRNFAADLSSYASNVLTGITGSVEHNTTCDASIVTGTATACDFILQNYAGTMTTGYGVRIRTFVGAPAGPANPVIGTLYGLRIQAPTLANGGTITNEWGISQESTTAKNYFAGNVGIGVAPSATALLNVEGIIRFAGSPTDPNSASGGYLWNQAGVGPTFSGFYLQVRTGATGVQAIAASFANDQSVAFPHYGAGVATFDVYGNFVSANTLSITGSITTGAPAGGTAKPWKFGAAVGGAPTPDGYLEAEVDGHTYKIAAQY